MDGEGAAAEQEGRRRLGAAVAGHRSWCPVEAGRAVRHTDQPDPNGLVVNQARPNGRCTGELLLLDRPMHNAHPLARWTGPVVASSRALGSGRGWTACWAGSLSAFFRLQGF